MYNKTKIVFHVAIDRFQMVKYQLLQLVQMLPQQTKYQPPWYLEQDFVVGDWTLMQLLMQVQQYAVSEMYSSKEWKRYLVLLERVISWLTISTFSKCQALQSWCSFWPQRTMCSISYCKELRMGFDYCFKSWWNSWIQITLLARVVLISNVHLLDFILPIDNPLPPLFWIYVYSWNNL